MPRTYLETKDGSVFTSEHPEYHKDCKRLPAAEGKRRQKEQSIKALRKILKPGDTVYCVLRHVSSSGMSRRIDLFAVKKNELVYLSGHASNAIEHSLHKDGGIVAGGCGMDMGFALVHNLGYALWPKGTRKPHGRRNGEPDSDGGYALKHCWL